MTTAKNNAESAPAATVTTYLFIVGVMLYFTVGSLFLHHHDLGWHIAAGDLIRSSHAIPKTDPWSFTAGNYPWLDISWLWDVAVSLLYQAGGFGAIIAATIVIDALTGAALVWICLRSGGDILPSVVATIWVMIALPLYEGPLDLVDGAAPQTMSIVFFLVCWQIMDIACHARRPKLLLLLPLIAALWANIHGGFITLFLIFGAYGAEAFWRKRHDQLRYLFGAAALCVAALFVNPYGADVVTGVLRTLLYGGKSSITDFEPYAFGSEVSSSAYLIVAILLINWTSDAVTLSNKLLAAGFLVLGLLEQRNLCFFMFTSLPLVVASARERFSSERYIALQQKLARDCADPLTRKRVFVLAAVMLALLVPAAMLRWPVGSGFSEELDPVEEINYVAEHFPGQNIYNHWNYGGFIIFHARDKLHVVVDGRGGTAYPPDIIEEFSTFNHEQEVIDRYHLRVAIMPRYIPDQLTYFETSSEWELAFHGKVANVYVRRDAATQQKGAH